MQNFTKYISRYNNDDTISITKIEILELSRSYQENQWLNVLRTLDNGSSTREWIYTKRHRSNINQYKWNSKATALFTLISCFFGCVVLIVMNRRTCCRIEVTLTVLYHIYEIEPFLSVCVAALMDIQDYTFWIIRKNCNQDPLWHSLSTICLYTRLGLKARKKIW